MVSFFIPSALVNSSSPKNRLQARSSSSGSVSKSFPSGDAAGPRCILVDSEALQSSPSLSGRFLDGKLEVTSLKGSSDSADDGRSRIPDLDLSGIKRHQLITGAYQVMKDSGADDDTSSNSTCSVTTCRDPHDNEGECQKPYWTPSAKPASPSLSHRSSRSQRSSRSFKSSRSHRSRTSSTLEPPVMSMSQPVHLDTKLSNSPCSPTYESPSSIVRSPGNASWLVANSTRGDIACKILENDREFAAAVAATTLLNHGSDPWESYRSVQLDQEQARVVEERVDALVEDFAAKF